MAAPISSSGAEAADWQGMQSDLGRSVKSPAAAAELVNLQAHIPGQLVARDGLVPVRFEVENPDAL